MSNANSATVVVWFQRPAFFYLHMYLCMNFEICFHKKKNLAKVFELTAQCFFRKPFNSNNNTRLTRSKFHFTQWKKNQLWQGMNKVKSLTVWQLQYKNGKSEFKIGNMYFTRKYLESCQYVWFFFAIVTSFKNCLKWQLMSTLCLKLRNFSTLDKFSYFIKLYTKKVQSSNKAT